MYEKMPNDFKMHLRKAINYLRGSIVYIEKGTIGA